MDKKDSDSQYYSYVRNYRKNFQHCFSIFFTSSFVLRKIKSNSTAFLLSLSSQILKHSFFVDLKYSPSLSVHRLPSFLNSHQYLDSIILLNSIKYQRLDIGNIFVTSKIHSDQSVNCLLTE